MGLTGQRMIQWDSFKDGKLGGAFADKWEQPDPQTLTLHLRPNSFWQNKAPVNGRATTVEDMKFHIERNKAGKLQDGTDDPNFYRKPDYQVVDTVTATDASTLKITFNKPAPLFLNLLAQSYEVVQAPEAVKQFEKSYAQLKADFIIGTGPYVMTEFNPDGHLTFKKNDKFAGKTFLNGHQEVPLFTDQSALQAAFEQKQVDTFAPSTVQTLNDLKSRLQGKIHDLPSFSANPMAGTYFGGAAPWNNPNLIGAIFRAYDRVAHPAVPRRPRRDLREHPADAAGIRHRRKGADHLPRLPRGPHQGDTEAKKMWQAGGGPALGDVTLDIPDICEPLYPAAP